jgi:hypothetical protein
MSIPAIACCRMEEHDCDVYNQNLGRVPLVNEIDHKQVTESQYVIEFRDPEGLTDTYPREKNEEIIKSKPFTHANTYVQTYTNRDSGKNEENAIHDVHVWSSMYRVHIVRLRPTGHDFWWYVLQHYDE